MIRSDNSQPVPYGMVFLELATPSHDVPPVLYAPPNTQPRAWPNANGEFTVPDVPDGEYVVVYFMSQDIQVVMSREGTGPMLVNSKAGLVIDIGTVKVTN